MKIQEIKIEGIGGIKELTIDCQVILSAPPGGHF